MGSAAPGCRHVLPAATAKGRGSKALPGGYLKKKPCCTRLCKSFIVNGAVPIRASRSIRLQREGYAALIMLTQSEQQTPPCTKGLSRKGAYRD